MIEVKNVSMSFRMSQDRIQSIKEYLVALIKGKLKYKDFWARCQFFGSSGRGAGDYRAQRRWEKHGLKGDFRHFKAYVRFGIRPWKYCAHAGVRQRI